MTERRGGFAVAVVVFLLFAISMAGVAGYQLVRLEVQLADQGENGELALSVASAGLDRYFGSQYGVPGDSVTYAIGGGTALIRSRKVAALDSVTDLYYIRSEGTVTDDRWPEAPVRRTASQYARLHNDPIGIHAALLVALGNVRVEAGGIVSGNDTATAGCPQAGAHDQAGVALTGLASEEGGTLKGSPPSVKVGNFDAIYDSAKVRWDVLKDPGFAIKHDGAPPSWYDIPSDSFPVVRATSALDPGGEYYGGRGVLIVPGEFEISWTAFLWDGIILAGSLGDFVPDYTAPWSVVRGLVIGQLNESSGNIRVANQHIYYHSCIALAASRSIAYLEPLERTWWQEN